MKQKTTGKRAIAALPALLLAACAAWPGDAPPPPFKAASPNKPAVSNTLAASAKPAV